MDKIDRKIAKLKKQNRSLREIAREVGISHVAVKNHLDRMETTEAKCSDPVNFDAEGKTRIKDHPDILNAVELIEQQLDSIAGIIGEEGFSIDSGRGWTVKYKVNTR